MLAITKSIALQGLEGYLVSIEVDISPGMPYFEIVGLPDMSVKESRERVKTAIKNSEINFASKRIIVNLAPANTRKGGSNFDLPIAVGNTISLQTLSQLSPDGQSSSKSLILANCASKIFTGNGDNEELKWWSEEFGNKREWKYTNSMDMNKLEYDAKWGIHIWLI